MEGTWSKSGGQAASPPAVAHPAARTTSTWLLPACLVVGGLTAVRLLVIGRGGFNLDFEEAQYWLWAQVPAWGYWTKPPMVAWLIAATTGVCGDAEPCVRLASPLLQGATAFVLGALGSAVGGPALGVWSTVIYATLPGVALSSVLITTDVPLLLCWAVALLAFVRLLDTDRWPWAALCGVAFGAGMLSKYSMLVFLPCVATFLALSRRRLRWQHVALGGALAGLLIAPNALWNLHHQLGTVHHSLSRVRPGTSSFGLDETVLFVVAQFGVFGPIMFPALIEVTARLWLRRRRLNERSLLLAAFTLVPLAIAAAVSIVARANPNWAAPAYVAGTVLVARELLPLGRARALGLTVALNAGLGMLLYGLLSAVPAITVPGGTLVQVRARLQGWDALGRRIAERADGLRNARILADLRELLAVAGYYGRIPAERLVEWNPSGVPHSQFQLQTHLDAGEPGPFLFVSYRPRPAGVLQRFDHVKRVATVTVPLGSGLTRTHWLFELRGFRGYPRGETATGAPSEGGRRRARQRTGARPSSRVM